MVLMLTELGGLTFALDTLISMFYVFFSTCFIRHNIDSPTTAECVYTNTAYSSAFFEQLILFA